MDVHGTGLKTQRNRNLTVLNHIDISW